MDYGKDRDILVRYLSRDIHDKRVLGAMSRVPRELFVPQSYRHAAYDDRPLDIGYGQTISQPFIVALMTEALALTGTEKVLEIGTGSGYQTAILAELSESVITVERVPELMNNARTILAGLGYQNIRFNQAGKALGLPEQAPYDAILVTAGAPSVPDKLLNQLDYGGVMVIPVGNRHLQELQRIVRGQDATTVTSLGHCRFVSLIGKDAWDN